MIISERGVNYHWNNIQFSLVNESHRDNRANFTMIYHLYT